MHLRRTGQQRRQAGEARRVSRLHARQRRADRHQARQAGSTAELLSIEADLSKRGIGLVILSMGGERLDTRNPTSKLMLTILAGVAGKYKGRPVSIDAAQIRQLRAELGPAAIAKRLGIARSSVYRALT